MEYKLKINGVDFSPYIAEDGIAASPVIRQGRDIVTLDGTLFRKELRKPAWSVELVTLADATLHRLESALTPLSTVEITAPDGTSVSRSFYISALHYSAKTVRGGRTYFSGVSFEMEAR